jgi:hypothetical protein
VSSEVGARPPGSELGRIHRAARAPCPTPQPRPHVPAPPSLTFLPAPPSAGRAPPRGLRAARARAGSHAAGRACPQGCWEHYTLLSPSRRAPQAAGLGPARSSADVTNEGAPRAGGGALGAGALRGWQCEGGGGPAAPGLARRPAPASRRRATLGPCNCSESGGHDLQRGGIGLPGSGLVVDEASTSEG